MVEPRGGRGELSHTPSLRLTQYKDNLSENPGETSSILGHLHGYQPTPTFSPDGHPSVPWRF